MLEKEGCESVSRIAGVLARLLFFFFSSRRRHTRSLRDWSSDVCSSDLALAASEAGRRAPCGSGDRAKRCSQDRKSTRLNSSHVESSYAVFCLKKKCRRCHMELDRAKRCSQDRKSTRLNSSHVEISYADI